MGAGEFAGAEILDRLAVGPRWKIGEAFDLEQPSSPQRSKTQTLSLASTVTALVGPQGLGVCAQFDCSL